MVSDGTDFKLYIPSRNRFLVGRNEIDQPSQNKLENLRPQHFLEALLVRPDRCQSRQGPAGELHRRGQCVLHPARGPRERRRAVAARADHLVQPLNLTMARQLIFDAAGNILTDARYTEWQPYDNVAFPKHIEINRPRDEYARGDRYREDGHQQGRIG